MPIQMVEFKQREFMFSLPSGISREEESALIEGKARFAVSSKREDARILAPGKHPITRGIPFIRESACINVDEGSINGEIIVYSGILSYVLNAIGQLVSLETGMPVPEHMTKQVWSMPEEIQIFPLVCKVSDASGSLQFRRVVFSSTFLRRGS